MADEQPKPGCKRGPSVELEYDHVAIAQTQVCSMFTKLAAILIALAAALSLTFVYGGQLIFVEVISVASAVLCLKAASGMRATLAPALSVGGGALGGALAGVFVHEIGFVPPSGAALGAFLGVCCWVAMRSCRVRATDLTVGSSNQPGASLLALKRLLARLSLFLGAGLVIALLLFGIWAFATRASGEDAAIYLPRFLVIGAIVGAFVGLPYSISCTSPGTCQDKAGNNVGGIGGLSDSAYEARKRSSDEAKDSPK